MELLADRDPEEARKILDPVLERMMEAVHRYEGTVNQVMGDGIMALFGAPLAHEDHAVRACYAALRMQEAIRPLHRRACGARTASRSRSASASTPATSSSARSAATSAWTTRRSGRRRTSRRGWSSSPRRAPSGSPPRRCALAEGYVAGEGRSARSRCKGVAEPVEVFELTGAARRADAAPGGAGARPHPLRGARRRDRSDPTRRRAGARRGSGQIVAVVGEPGVGKSRLFYEFIHSHHVRPGLAACSSRARCPTARPRRYLPLADLLRGYFRIDDRDDTRERPRAR